MSRLWAAFAVALVVSAGVSGWQGHRLGYAAAVADHKAETLARIEAGRILDDDRRRLAQERDQLADELKGGAYAQPVVSERCLGPGRVQRLNALR